MNNNQYFDPILLSKVNNLSLAARFVVEGFLVGLHKSPFHGFSAEFSEYRPYNEGEDTRFVDWRYFGKTDRFYVKRFEEETNLRATIILDSSASMGFASGKISKLDYGSFLSAALSHLLLKQRDAVGLTIFDKSVKIAIPPRSKPSHLKEILTHISNTKAEGETDIATNLHKIANQTKKRGMIILISDLLDEPESVISGLKHFRYQGNDVVVFHLLDPQEIEFDYRKNTKFVDLENSESLMTEPWKFQKAYQKTMEDFIVKYRTECRNNSMDYNLVQTAQPLDITLREMMMRRL
ncbi:MAG: DUF58 domain-containing protein [Candidatus Marinimicrobia bacterium]|nr:DUF58 domain-containing protein [Candidatus Neomarinimicrobiota bacterium]